jgi:hypothetical protein
VTIRMVCDQPGEGRLARARRAPEDARPHVAPPDQIAQRLPGTEQVFLAQEVFQPSRPHAGRQRLRGAGEQRRIRHSRPRHQDQGRQQTLAWVDQPRGHAPGFIGTATAPGFTRTATDPAAARPATPWVVAGCPGPWARGWSTRVGTR